MRTRRVGVTLIETLVVMGVIGILLAILIPAVQYAREVARKSTCENNMHQLVPAIHNYESAHASLPSLYNGTFLQQPRNALDEFHFHSWRTAILPQLEQSSLCERIDFSLPATDAANQTNLNTTVATFVCPSTTNQNAVVPDIFAFNDPSKKIGTAARSERSLAAYRFCRRAL